jgi:poly(hydroxyalkanoate) granule-associated protein
MAKLKKSARKTTAASTPNLQKQAEQLSRNLSESAQQVWLAGVGAFGRAQAEGTKLFETLVKEGLSVEQVTRKAATGKVDAVRDAVESTVGQARERASDTWDRLEKVFEDRVQRALRRLEVPSREDLGALIDRVDTLTNELRKVGATPAARKPAVKKAAKPAAKPAPASDTVARKAAPRKAAPRKSARKPAA